MLENLQNFCDNFKKHNITFTNKRLTDILQGFLFIYISDETTNTEKDVESALNQVKDTEIIILDQSEKYNQYIIICFEKALIILKQSKTTLSYLHKLLSLNHELSVCCLSKLEIEIQNKIIQFDTNFQNEINSMKKSIQLYHETKEMKQIWSLIVPCISGYLIKKSYLKLNKNRFEEYPAFESISENDYIELRTIGTGSSFSCILIYNIIREELNALKKPHEINEETEKLIQREKSNYMKIKHPYLLKFYGFVKDKNYVIVEYINGMTLKDIDEMELSDKDRMIIIFKLMQVIKYFHENGFIYRDLKPTNVMIDEQKNVVLIDVDLLRSINDDSEHTLNFCSEFSDPDINESNIFTYESDIYSLGKMIEYIMIIHNDSSFRTKVLQNDFDEYFKLAGIIRKCTKKKANNRPEIFEVISEFQSIIQSKYSNEFDELFAEDSKDLFNLGMLHYKRKDIKKSVSYFQLAANQNDINAQFQLGVIFYEGKYVPRDVNQAIKYFELAANQNDLGAQVILGVTYYEGKLIERDIGKTIKYLSLASNQNDPQSQYNLGIIYFEGKYVPRDINKSIQYLELSAKQNYSKAQFKLGIIFYDGKYIARDINKAIFYYTLAANNNIPGAQFILGLIYCSGRYIQSDIQKAIYYFKLAANQNLPEAQLYLNIYSQQKNSDNSGIDKSILLLKKEAQNNDIKSQLTLAFFYYEGKYAKRDINKAIYYFSLAAKQDVAVAHYYLGIIYYEKKCIERDIDKAIKYFTIASDHNIPEAYFYLGIIFYEGKYVKIDIDKAIHYFTLASQINHSLSHFYLGWIYFNKKYGKFDINKSIYYLTNASNRNIVDAQLILGLIYFLGLYSTSNIKKGKFYIMLASENENKLAYFLNGFLYHEGKNEEKDINKAIHFYKKASSFNIQYAKNNLGIIYKNGYDDIIEKNIYYAIEFFEEAIRQKKDPISMYNLAHIYIYEETIKQDYKKSIELLINSSNDFYHSLILLCLILIKQNGFDIKKIEHSIEKQTNKNSDLSSRICQTISSLNLFDHSVFNIIYAFYQKIDFLYNIQLTAIPSFDLYRHDKTIPKYPFAKNITYDFYDGFGNDL